MNNLYLYLFSYEWNVFSSYRFSDHRTVNRRYQMSHLIILLAS